METIESQAKHFDLYKAYKRIPSAHKNRAEVLHSKLDLLLDLARQLESPLLRRLKPTIVVSLKWRFDYLIKTLESPFELEKDVDYWISTLEAMKHLGQEGWFPLDGQSKEIDPWTRTAQGFDLGWTTTTENERFEISKRIARDRLAQIYAMWGGPEKIKGATILDSGCGPGRYIDEMRQYGPKKIVGLDQGAKLVNVLRERFAGDERIEIVKGTCEDLSQFADNTFDIVFSNGVIHHTKSDLKTMFEDHARVLKPGGVMFIMLVGKGGLELKVWEFARNLLNDVPLETMLSLWKDVVSDLRLQGIVDHMYGEYQELDRDTFESWAKPLFKKIEPVAGIEGLDITPEIYSNDPYFEARFGTGHLRYLLYK
ncbi:MAG: class I SAM-dependent methyltransferase [Bdellovibrionales bacterium]